MKQGLFITLEGADGSGKTTQMDRIVQFFEQNKIDYIVTREPGGMDLGQKIRDILLNYDGEVDSTCEMFLYLADRAQHMQTKIKKALAEGKVVLCDRHTDSTLAYQGYARGLDIDEINLLNNIATRGKKPDLTLLFDVDTSVAMQRVGNRADKDRMESEGAKFHQKVRQGYLEIAKKEPERIKVVNSNLDIEAVWSQVSNLLRDFLNLQSK
ncbi:MAG: dTMP kinase [bacterium]